MSDGGNNFPCEHGVPFGKALPNCRECTNLALGKPSASKVKPKFAALFGSYPPPIRTEENRWGGPRWAQQRFSGIDLDGNVWGLYMDTCSESPIPALRWIKFEAEALG